MSGKSRSRSTLDGMAHRHYQDWATGDGVAVEFPLTHTVLRGDDVQVYLNGAIKRPAAGGVAHDYAIRGITAGYPGDSNRIKFAAAPGGGATILFVVAAG